MIRLSAALCVIAFAATLSACKPETPPVASAVPGLLIDCDLLKPRSLDGNAQANCRQPLPDSSGMSASFQFTDTADGQRTGMVGIAAADDTPQQTITYPAAGTVGLPLFLDLDSDGRADMLVPQPGEDENVPYAVWQNTGSTPPFTLAGGVLGMEIVPVGDGIFEADKLIDGNPAKTVWESSYYIFQDSQLVLIATSRVVLPEDGAARCTVQDAGALAETGLTPEAAQEKFCDSND